MRRLSLFFLPTLCLACAHQQVDDYYGSRGNLPTQSANAAAAANSPRAEAAGAGESAACQKARVHFDRDDTLLHPDDYPVLQKLAQCLQADPARIVRIDGNADERGTTDYNLALGDRRARSVAGYLKLLGVRSDQLATVSFGKEKPLCAEHDESCWQQNRRAGLTLGH